MGLRKLIWVVGLVALAGLIALISLVISLNTTASTGTQQLVARLTSEAQTTAVRPTPTDTPPVVTALPSPTVTSSGFILELEPRDAPLIADGQSRTQLTVSTTDVSFTGQTVVFTVLGGGYVDPPELVLPSVGEQVSVDYITGNSASEIRIEAVVVSGGRPYIQTVTLRSEWETVALSGIVLQPLVPTTPFSIPISVSLVSVNTPAVFGTYQLRAYAMGGEIRLSPEAPSASVLDFTLVGNGQPSSEATMLFSPLSEQQPGRMQVQILSRPDIPPFETEFYWTNLTARLALGESSGTFGSASGISETLLEIPGEISLCAHAYDAFDQPILPNFLALQYENLLGTQPEVLSSSDQPLLQGQAYRFHSRNGMLYQNDREAACFRVAPRGAGLVRLALWADRADMRTETLALAHFGRVALRHLPGALNISLPRLDGGNASLSFTSLDAPLLYLGAPDNRENLIVSFWLAAEQVDMVNGTLLPVGDTLPIVTDPLSGQEISKLTITDYAPLASSYVAQNLTVQVDETRYVRVFAAAQIAPGVLLTPPTELPLTGTEMVTPEATAFETSPW